MVMDVHDELVRELVDVELSMIVQVFKSLRWCLRSRAAVSGRQSAIHRRSDVHARTFQVCADLVLPFGRGAVMTRFPTAVKPSSRAAAEPYCRTDPVNLTGSPPHLDVT
jgi:hypothetical protein